MHQSSWRVGANAEKVSVFSGGRTEAMAWPTIKGIALEVQPAPYGTDIYWHVLGTDGDLVFPMEAEGQAEILHFFQTLPGFNNDKVLEAIQSSEEAWFMVWQAY